MALFIGEDRWTYGRLDALADAVCRWLLEAGIPENRRIGVLMESGLAYVGLVHACARLGLVLIPFNTRLAAVELGRQIAWTDCRLLIADETAAAGSGSEPVRLLENLRILPAAEIPRQAPPAAGDQPPAEVDPLWNDASALEAVQAIVFTSGTSGRPKAVPITFRQHFFSALGSAYRLGVQPEDLWLSCLPLYHVGGLGVLFRSCLYGTAVDLHPRFDLEEIKRALDARPITLISLVPTMLVRLLEARARWPASLRLVLLGGAATPPALVAAAAAQGLPLAVSYGMTEAASQIATMMPDGVVRKPGCVGRPLLFTVVRIVEEDGRPAAAGAYGEIQVRGPVLTAGYLDLPEENAGRFRDGWFDTGDIGYLDGDGDLWLVQRRSDLIISGGENIYPAEVEAVLRAHPAVREICVVGLPDDEWGERVAAMVELERGQLLSPEELLAFGRERLAGYKLPRLIRIVEQMPVTAAGKIARAEVLAKIRE